MHQGKHQEYEKRLHDALIAQMQQQSQQPTTGSSDPATTSPVSNAGSSNGIGNGSGSTNNGIPNNVDTTTTTIKDHATANGGNNGTVNNGQIQKDEAWPSLSTSPVTIKENKTSMKGSEFLIKSCKFIRINNFFFLLFFFL